MYWIKNYTNIQNFKVLSQQEVNENESQDCTATQKHQCKKEKHVIILYMCINL